MAQFKLHEINSILELPKIRNFYKPTYPGNYVKPRCDIREFRIAGKTLGIDDLELYHIVLHALKNNDEMVMAAFRKFLMISKLLYNDCLDDVRKINNKNLELYNNTMDLYKQELEDYNKKIKDIKNYKSDDIISSWKEIILRYKNYNVLMMDEADKGFLYALANVKIKNQPKRLYNSYSIQELYNLVDFDYFLNLNDIVEIKLFISRVKGNVCLKPNIKNLVI